MREAIEKRISRRTYRPEPLGADTTAKIQAMIDASNAESGLTMQFVEDGSAAFARARKTYGMFKNVRSLILMKGPANLPDLKEKAGYYGEGLMLDLVDMDLGTCWVGGTFDRTAFSIPDCETLVLCMLVGRIDKPTLRVRQRRGLCAGSPGKGERAMILVSACLADERCRTDGKDKLVSDIRRLVESGEAITVCPEVLGGLPTPRSRRAHTMSASRRWRKSIIFLWSRNLTSTMGRKRNIS